MARKKTALRKYLSAFDGTRLADIGKDPKLLLLVLIDQQVTDMHCNDQWGQPMSQGEKIRSMIELMAKGFVAIEQSIGPDGEERFAIRPLPRPLPLDS
jgi:hypothetical protein